MDNRDKIRESSNKLKQLITAEIPDDRRKSAMIHKFPTRLGILAMLRRYAYKYRRLHITVERWGGRVLSL